MSLYHFSCNSIQYKYNNTRNFQLSEFDSNDILETTMEKKSRSRVVVQQQKKS